MKTIEIKLYKFDELSEEAKERAINDNRDINTYFDWWDCVYDDAYEIGLKISSFDTYRKQIDGSFADYKTGLDVAFLIKEKHGEKCETYKAATNFIDEYNEMFAKYEDENKKGYVLEEREQDFDDELEDMEENFLKELLECYLIMLEEEYEYRESDEAIIETFEANDYDFTANGKIY